MTLVGIIAKGKRELVDRIVILRADPLHLMLC